MPARLIDVAEFVLLTTKAAALSCGAIDARRVWNPAIDLERIGRSPVVMIHPGPQSDTLADRAATATTTYTVMVTMHARVLNAEPAAVDVLVKSMVEICDAVRIATYTDDFDFTGAKLTVPCGWAAEHDNVYIGVAELTFEGDRA